MATADREKKKSPAFWEQKPAARNRHAFPAASLPLGGTWGRFSPGAATAPAPPRNLGRPWGELMVPKAEPLVGGEDKREGGRVLPGEKEASGLGCAQVPGSLFPLSALCSSRDGGPGLARFPSLFPPTPRPRICGFGGILTQGSARFRKVDGAVVRWMESRLFLLL